MPFLGKSPTAGFASIVKDDLTPNGSTTAFTLSKQVANANDIAVFLGNVRQEPTDAYTVSGTTLTMSEAPASGLNFYVLHIAGTVESSVVPADNTISTAKIQNNAVNLTSKVTGTLPVGSGGTGITSGFKNGIETADMWRMTTTTTTADNRSTGIFTDWQRVYQINGMTEANGVFTFPSTGIYEIELAVRFMTSSTSARHLGGGMLVSTDSGSSFANSSLMDDVTMHMVMCHLIHM